MLSQPSQFGVIYRRTDDDKSNDDQNHKVKKNPFIYLLCARKNIYWTMAALPDVNTTVKEPGVNTVLKSAERNNWLVGIEEVI